MDLVTLLNLDREVESMFKKPDEEKRLPESEPSPHEPPTQTQEANKALRG